MLRLLLIALVVLLPTALAIAYLHFRRDVDALPRWLAKGPWIWLILAGIIVAAAALFDWGLTRAPPDSVYVPPHMEGGHIVPGTHAPPAE